MALNENNLNAYNIRRAQAFAAAGISARDLRYATPEFVGKSHGDCSLCGKKDIVWLFALHFAKPNIVDMIGAIDTEITRTDAVSFNPVGSECIETWAEPLPESKEKLEFLIRWKKELRKLAIAKSVAYTLSILNKGGWESVDAIVTYVKNTSEAVLVRALPSWSERRGLVQYTKKLAREGRLSPNVTKFVVIAANKVVAYLAAKAPVSGGSAPTPPAPPAAPAQPLDSVLVRAQKIVDGGLLANANGYQAKTIPDILNKVLAAGGKFFTSNQKNHLDKLCGEVEAQSAPKPAKVAKPVDPLVARAEAVIADPEMFGCLEPKYAHALTDIVAKFKKYGSFYSDGQKNYLESIVKMGEMKGVKQNKTPPGYDGTDQATAEALSAAEAVNGPKAGDATFTSASKISGARY